MNKKNISVTKMLFLLDTKRMISEFQRRVMFPDEMPSFMYRLNLAPTSGFSEGVNITNLSGNGVSIKSEKEALIKCVSESIERFSMCVYSDKEIIYSKFTDITNEALDPASISGEVSDRYKEIGWVKTSDAVNQKDIFLPAESVYLNFKSRNDNYLLKNSFSTGAAAALSPEQAMLKGIYELVERDAFLVNYLNSVPTKQIDPISIQNPFVKKYINEAEKYKLTITFLDITSDLEIPTILCLILDKTGLGPPLVCGLKTSFFVSEALQGSLEEALMIRFWVRNLVLSRKGFKGISPNKILNAQDRALFWLPGSMVQKVPFWFTGRKTVLKQELTRSSPDKELKKVLKILSSKDLNIFYKDISMNSFKNEGHFVYKVIIPQLQTFYLNEQQRIIKTERLNKVANYFGLPKKEINKIPHPML